MSASEREAAGDPRARALPVVLAWLVLCAVHLGASLPTISLPGVYYDEPIQAVPALDFLRGHLRALPPPGVRSVEVLGRPFPWQTQPYMGALKSQLLIPTFALLGAGVEVLRLTTTLWALGGLLLFMLWARRVLGTPVALAAGALLAVDPSFLLVARHDWGSFALGLLLRGAGLWLATRWWSSRRPLELAAAGLALGLGIYNKVDFAAFLAGGAVMLVACRPDVVRELAGRERRSLAWGALGLAAGAAPAILATASQLRRAASVVASAGGLAEKLGVAWLTLDGSYFYRMLAAGGRFQSLLATEAPHGLLGLAYLASLGILLCLWLWRRPVLPSWRAAGFVAGTAILTQAALLLIPGAVRIHHALNAYPFPHLVVATAAVAAWRASAGLARGRTLARSAVAGGLAATLAAQGLVTGRTLALIERSGGRGWWSDAIYELAREIDGRPRATVISLDWGFQQPLLFLTQRAHLIEPVWYLRRDWQRGLAWSHEGAAHHVYLVHEPRYDMLGFGSGFLAAISGIDAALLEVRSHREREGEVAFLAVRILSRHRLRYRGDGFALDLY